MNEKKVHTFGWVLHSVICYYLLSMNLSDIHNVAVKHFMHKKLLNGVSPSLHTSLPTGFHFTGFSPSKELESLLFIRKGNL